LPTLLQCDEAATSHGSHRLTASIRSAFTGVLRTPEWPSCAWFRPIHSRLRGHSRWPPAAAAQLVLSVHPRQPLDRAYARRSMWPQVPSGRRPFSWSYVRHCIVLIVGLRAVLYIPSRPTDSPVPLRNTGHPYWPRRSRTPRLLPYTDSQGLWAVRRRWPGRAYTLDVWRGVPRFTAISKLPNMVAAVSRMDSRRAAPKSNNNKNTHFILLTMTNLCNKFIKI